MRIEKFSRKCKEERLYGGGPSNISLVNMKVKGIDFLIIACAWITIYTRNLIDIGGE